MKKIALTVFVLTSFLLSCTKATKVPTQAPLQVTKVLRLAIWSNYLSETVIKDFEVQTGAKVEVSNYSSNEELLAKLQAGASGYDVIVPSDYMVFAMIQLGLLKELNKEKIQNLAGLDPKFMKKIYDPTNKFSLPYTWGTTGIAINRSIFKGKIKSWKDLFTLESLKGKFSLLDDARETLGASLRAQGLSLNTKNPSDLKKAKDLIMKARTRIKAFTSEPMAQLISGETAVAHAYSSDAFQAARDTGGKVEYIIPEEGGTLWTDNLAIPATSTQIELALDFINYMLDPKTEVTTVSKIFVAPVNLKVLELLSSELKNNPVLFPSPTVLKKLERMEDLGEAASIWDRTWTEVKAEGN